MTVHRLADAAALLGVSDDTLRRWIEQGRCASARTEDDRAGVDGVELARLAAEVSSVPEAGSSTASLRNRMRGIVTKVTRGTVMAQVDMVCGPYRIVSVITREAADDLGLEPGVVAWANVKSTNVSVDVTP